MKTTYHSGVRAGVRKNVQRASLVAGAAFALVGVLGFIPGITTEYQSLDFAGNESQAMLFGVFQVSVLHNLVHLLFGIAGLTMARRPLPARNFLIGAGVACLMLWVAGLILAQDSPVNIVPLNIADNWLHLTLGMGLIALGVAFSRDAPAQVRESATPEPTN
ncbi:DUF4383 domain-containing protein [Arthrobacter sp. 92]|jgi:hypothetical protein|uniref:DUF4383 domain-containing protein n=1 Tax=Arthrobacter sp. 92 TaxID=3418175 RepID=UPI003CFDC4DE